MKLIARVIRYRSGAPKDTISAAFDRLGGTLGRSQKNNLFLPDPEKFVSRWHARIHHRDGLYFLEDTSKSGTSIANRNIDVHRKTVPLVDGDIIRIGEFDISIRIVKREDDDGDASLFEGGGVEGAKNDHLPGRSIDDEKKPSRSQNIVPPRDPSPIHDTLTPPIGIRPLDKPQTIPESWGIDQFFDTPDDIPKPPEGQESPEIPPISVKDDVGGVEDFFTGPSVIAGQVDPNGERNGEARNPQPNGSADRVPESVASKPGSQGSLQTDTDLLKIFLDAAGIKGQHFIDREQIPELMRTIGTVFRELIGGLMIILRGRAELKSQARVSVTTLRAVDNNPLKFSPNVSEALRILLKKDHTGYMSALDAVHESCSDIMYHQLALAAGIQAYVGELLKRFDPQHFTQKYEEGIVFQKKAKCWDAYCAAYDRIVDVAQEEIFGEAFQRAYEEQMTKLRRSRKKK